MRERVIPLSGKHKRKRHLRIRIQKLIVNNQTSSNTHYLSFTQEPFEVVFLDVHHAGDVRDIKVVVLHMVGLQVYLDTWNKHLNQLQELKSKDDVIDRSSTWTAWLPCGVFPAASVWQQNSFHKRWGQAASCLLSVKIQQCSCTRRPF